MPQCGDRGCMAKPYSPCHQCLIPRGERPKIQAVWDSNGTTGRVARSLPVRSRKRRAAVGFGAGQRIRPGTGSTNRAGFVFCYGQFQVFALPRPHLAVSRNPCPGSSGVEQGIENPRVGGSIPPPGTIFINLNKALGWKGGKAPADKMLVGITWVAFRAYPVPGLFRLFLLSVISPAAFKPRFQDRFCQYCPFNSVAPSFTLSTADP